MVPKRACPELTRSPLSWSESWYPLVHPTLFDADTAPSSPSSLSLLHPSSLPKLASNSPHSEDNLEHLIPLPLPPKSGEDRLECHTWFMRCWGSKPGLLCACRTCPPPAELHLHPSTPFPKKKNLVNCPVQSNHQEGGSQWRASAPKMVC